MKIFVDEIPETCGKCMFYDYSCHVGDGIHSTYTKRCILTRKVIEPEVAYDVRFTKDCPLTLLKTK